MIFSSTLAAVAFTSLFLRCAVRAESLQGAVPLEQLWAQYSPFFPVGQYNPPPAGCEIIQANIIQRHGARYPTAGAALGIVSGVSKLQGVSTAFQDPKLEFLKTYEYDLRTDDLVTFGAQQSSNAGEVAFKRYSHLISESNLPFVRASQSERVMLSATNWTAGFSKASNNQYNPKLSVTISEAKGANNTLDDNNCPAQVGSDAQTDRWISVFAPPITQRLNKAAPGANLTDQEIYSLMSLCAFDTVAHLCDGRYPNNQSPFCDLFSKREFEFFEYEGDLDKFYNTGYGNPLGPVQGVGYVNELLARLTSTPVKDSTQTNHTLDDSPVTFPLNRTVYADFSHDNQIIPIYASIGLFRQKEALNPQKYDPSKTWKASQLVPFAGRMVVEKLECSSRTRDRKEYVRIFVNDALQPLEFCSYGHGSGLCTLDDFVESQAYARNNGQGDFEKCFQ
ncbi:phytase [Marasmius fiardii PR-910]|nr:phytase [Marasmius fiardii PR-910]